MVIQIPDMDLGKIEASGQCFRMEEGEPGHFAVIAGERFLEICYQGECFALSCSEEEFGGFWSRYFDLGTDYRWIREKVEKGDEYLSQAAKAGQGIRILRQDPWEMVATFIISQQNNIPRIKKCIGLLCRRYGRRLENFRGEAYYGFPSPEALAGADLEGLRGCNLGYRARYILETAKAVAGEEVSLKALEGQDHHKVKKELMKLCGVGEKVAECVCLFGFHHVDAFPVDTHIAQVLKAHYPEGFPFKRYKGFAGILQQYMFYYELHGAGQRDMAERG